MQMSRRDRLGLEMSEAALRLPGRPPAGATSASLTPPRAAPRSATRASPSTFSKHGTLLCCGVSVRACSCGRTAARMCSKHARRACYPFSPRPPPLVIQLNWRLFPRCSDDFKKEQNLVLYPLAPRGRFKKKPKNNNPQMHNVVRGFAGRQWCPPLCAWFGV